MCVHVLILERGDRSGFPALWSKDIDEVLSRSLAALLTTCTGQEALTSRRRHFHNPGSNRIVSSFRYVATKGVERNAAFR